MRIAAFITPHGFGHAARASAVMDALHEVTGAGFEIFTAVPEAFFSGLLQAPFRYHPLEADVGLRQASALEVDLGGTLAALESFRAGVDETVARAAEKVDALGCALTLSDISPLGVLVGESLGIPSVLVENFTWDWIYEPLLAQAPGLASHAGWFAEIYQRADHRFQAGPACREVPGARAVSPVARVPRRSREEVREELGLDPAEPVTLLTLGGVAQELPFLGDLGRARGHFLVTGSGTHRREGNLTFFSLEEPVYTPDLMAASDRVVAKLGYSTAAEAWLQDRPLAFVANPVFRETKVLRPFLQAELDTREFSREAFLSGAWLDDPWMTSVAARRPSPGLPSKQRRSGAVEIADAVGSWA